MSNLVSRAIVCFVLIALVSVASTPSATAQDEKKDPAAIRAYNAAAGLQNLGSHERAANKWKQFVNEFPDDDRIATARYYHGYCLLRAGKPKEAADVLSEVVKQHGNADHADAARYYLGMARYELARAAKDANQLKQAAATLSEVAEKHGDSRFAHRALYYAGDAYFTAGDPQAAMKVYAALIKDHPNGQFLARAYYDLGVAQQELGQHEQAIETFGKFLDNETFVRDPLAAEIRLRLGVSLFDQGKFAEAAQQFEQAAAANDFPQADYALLRLGQCLVRQGEIEPAAKQFEELVTKYSKSPYRDAAQLAAGRAYYQLNKLGDARKYLEPLAKSDGSEALEASYWLAQTLLKEGKPEEAARRAEAALSGEAEGPFVPYLTMAHIDALYEIEVRRTETGPLYEKFAEDYSQHALAPQALYMAALTALGGEQYQKSAQLAERFLQDQQAAQGELAPEVLYIAGESYLLSGNGQTADDDLQKAGTFYRQIVEKHSSHPRAARAKLRIGWCLYHNGKLDEAVKHLAKAVGELSEPDQKAEAHLLIGRSRAADEKHDEAVEAFKKADDAAGDDWTRGDELLLVWAQSLRAADQNDDASEKLKQLVSQHAESSYCAQATDLLGDLALAEKQYDEAIRQYREVVEKHPNSEYSAESAYGLAAAQFAQGDYEDAIRTIDERMKDSPQGELSHRSHYLRGLANHELKNYEAAVRDLERYLDSEPEAAQRESARFTQGLSQVGLNKFDEAEKTFQQLLSEAGNQPQTDKFYYELGHVYLAQKKNEAAAETFRKLAEQFPDSNYAGEAWFHVGSAVEAGVANDANDDSKNAARKQAEESFRKGLAAAKQPELVAKLRYKLGDVLFQQEQYAEAAEVLRADRSEGGELGGAIDLLSGLSLFRANQYEQALPRFEKVVKQNDPELADEALYYAGASAAAVEKWSDSQKYYETLLSKYPDFERIHDARYGAGRALMMQGKEDDALKLFEQVTETTEAEPAAKARFMIGEIAFGRDQYEDAIEHFLLASGYPYKEWQVQSQYEIARCLISLDRKEKAKSVLEKLIETHSDHPKAQDAEKIISAL